MQGKDDIDCVKRNSGYEVSGYAGRGRGRKTWNVCENDVKTLNLDPLMAADRGSWRRLVRVSV